MKNNKVILIILDGLANEVATKTLGHIHSFIESGIAKHQPIVCELPSISRPLYETILTGIKPVDSGIYTNNISHMSKEKSIFHYAKEAGLVTAAAAYHWVSELYNQYPYNKINHRYQNNKDKAIQHGIFYNQDNYPDEALFQDAEYLRYRFDPDFMLIHPMNIDYYGHKFGVESEKYYYTAKVVDSVMGEFIPSWISKGYQLIITADHGMCWDKTHGGMSDLERIVPLYTIGNKISEVVPDNKAKQINIIDYIRKTLNC